MNVGEAMASGEHRRGRLPTDLIFGTGSATIARLFGSATIFMVFTIFLFSSAREVS